MKKIVVFLITIVIGVFLVPSQAFSYDIRGWWSLTMHVDKYDDRNDEDPQSQTLLMRAHFYREGNMIRCPFWWYDYDDTAGKYFYYYNTTSNSGPGDNDNFLFLAYPFGLEVTNDVSSSFYQLTGENTLNGEDYSRNTGFMGTGKWEPYGTTNVLMWERTTPFIEPMSHIFTETYINGVADPPMPVFLDIKPGGCQNPLNPKTKGRLPVAILGSDTFDVRRIDATELELNGVKPTHFSYEDVATPFVGDAPDCHDLGPDGHEDLILKFNAQDIISTLGDIDKGQKVVLTIKGYLVGGTWLPDDGARILGTDSVVITGGKD